MTRFTKIIYILLFILIVLTPHLGIGHLFSIPERYLQSLVTLALFAVALCVYLLHQRDIRRKDEEKQKLENRFSFSSKKLNDAYQYIGSVNRKLSLLSAVGTDLLKKPKETKKGRRVILEELLMTAVTTLGHSSWGMFRFIHTATGRTEQELVHIARGYILLRSTVSNNELLQTRQVSGNLAGIGDLHVISTSDRSAPVQCFLIFAKGKNNIEDEISTLRAIVDQAQLFYTYLSKTPEAYRGISPIAKES
ncbi:hypothetical protein A2Z10_02670 [Candidatus Azambacteria bacterium RBG_16_47_10]|uniref:Uncharacterized protein n=1 Tax=Candidatus Azambacteria bacterium RBG_16_47_10 TaxID=1797292 RepID=A0A1F5B169_9BACT|nr:MAG: hypothetical protein A2Z10_02670 [Candidatus Azambacteria bacterium RBG_16_47_10]